MGKVRFVMLNASKITQFPRVGGESGKIARAASRVIPLRARSFFRLDLSRPPSPLSPPVSPVAWPAAAANAAFFRARPRACLQLPRALFGVQISCGDLLDGDILRCSEHGEKESLT